MSPCSLQQNPDQRIHPMLAFPCPDYECPEYIKEHVHTMCVHVHVCLTLTNFLHSVSICSTSISDHSVLFQSEKLFLTNHTMSQRTFSITTWKNTHPEVTWRAGASQPSSTDTIFHIMYMGNDTFYIILSTVIFNILWPRMSVYAHVFLYKTGSGNGATAWDSIMDLPTSQS